MISLSRVAYLTRYYVEFLVTAFLFKCEIQPLLPLAYKFSRPLKGSTISGTSWTCCCAPSWSIVVILLSTSIFSGSLGFREVLSSRSSAHPHNGLGLPQVLKKMDLFHGFFILKFRQNFLQLRLSKLSVLMGRFIFWGRKQAADPGCFIGVPSEEKILCAIVSI